MSAESAASFAAGGPPILETERLILRPHGIEDFDDLAAMWADPEVVRYISGVPSTAEASWSRLLRYIGHWQALGFGYWAVILRDTGAYAGDVGFADYKRMIEPDLGAVPEAGWVLSPAVHGRGVATEAVRCIHHWAEAQTKWARTCCIFDPDHKVSQKVAVKLGYHTVSDSALYNEKPTLVMQRDIPR